MSDSKVGELGIDASLQAGGYEAPELTPIGNLRDLLATGTGSQCDESEQPATGTEPALCP
jgi:hypothetical protein